MVIVVTNGPGRDRHLLVIPVEDEWGAKRLAAQLRDEGLLALAGPDDGPRLEAWVEHTRPLTFGGRLSRMGRGGRGL